MKKAIKSIILCLVLGVCVALSGCINLQAEAYQDSAGITMLVYGDGDDFYAQIIVVATDIESTTREADDYIFSLLSTEFETERSEEYPVFEVELGGGGRGTQFTYFCKLNNDSWAKSAQKVEYGFLTAKVSNDYENFFADAYKNGTELNNIYNLMKNGGANKTGGSLEPYSKYFNGANIDDINTKMLVYGRSSLSAVTGSVVYGDGSYYYQNECILSETKQGGAGNRIQYTYKAMVSYGWFTLAIIFGLVAVGCVLLFAKKKEGKAVDLTNRGPFVSNKDDFGAYGGASYPFEGFGGPGSNSAGGSNSGSGQGNGGSPFDGF